MKYLKTLGLAAVAATALMAFGGPSTASAYTLCELGVPKNTNECLTGPNGESRHYTSGTTFTAEAKDPKLTLTGPATEFITCEKSNVAVKTTGTGSDDEVAVPGEVESLTFTNCHTASGFGCTFSESQGYISSIGGTTNGNGTLTVEGAIKTKVTCGGIFVCEYEPPAAGISMSLTGGNPAGFTANAVKLNQVPGGIGCGAEAHWDADYKLVAPGPTALWVGTKDV